MRFTCLLGSLTVCFGIFGSLAAPVARAQNVTITVVADEEKRDGYLAWKIHERLAGIAQGLEEA